MGADVSISHPITQASIDVSCGTFPSCFFELQASLRGLKNVIPQTLTFARDMKAGKPLSFEQNALYEFAKSYIALTKASTTLSDAELSQDGVKFKMGFTNRTEVSKLLNEANSFIKKSGLESQTIHDIAAIKLYHDH